MKICVAQTRPIKGDVPANIARHKPLIELAVAKRAEIVIFPELSLTGYEPTLAQELATTPDDRRFDDFQEVADRHQITIGVGAATTSGGGICITMVLFRPGRPRQTYSKAYLHPDEESFFVSGRSSLGLLAGCIGLAICYELSVPEHAERALHKGGAEIYLASVAKTAQGVEKAAERLAEIAKRYSIPVLMSNCVGLCDGVQCGGRTSVWNETGVLLGQLNDAEEGVLVFDTDSQAVSVDTTPTISLS